MSCCSSTYRSRLFLLIGISLVIRAILAAWLEFGNDEVYYWTYALYPDWSHFDHPPMVGWIMQLFSLNLFFDSEFFLRLSSVLLMSINTLLIFQIGKQIKNELTGFYAALLYNASIYAFVITGIFILPDTPQNFFWLLAVLAFLKAFGNLDPSLISRNQWLILGGLFSGLAMISKYTSIYIWFGAFAYILLFDRKWLKTPALYLSLVISFICVLPVIFWNIGNDFISFSFQGNRVSIWGAPLRPDLFLTELFGQIAYNNPINFGLIVVALASMLKREKLITKAYTRILLLWTLPLILTFLFFSLFRGTLPHWTGPAYNLLLLFAAAWLANKHPAKDGIPQLPSAIKSALALLIFVLLLGSIQIKFGLIPFEDKNPYEQLGKNDVTLDMYGWRETMAPFAATVKKETKKGMIEPDAPIVANNWFPLANIDYYIARPLGMKVLGLGEPERLHKYLWVNNYRGGLHAGDDYWYLTTSRDYTDPQIIYKDMFDAIIPSDTITIERGNRPAKRVFVFILKGLKPEAANNTKNYLSSK